MKHIEEFNPKTINHKYNLFEKNNCLINLFLNSISKSGWTNVIYSDKDITVVFNEETKSLICALVFEMSNTELEKLQSANIIALGPTVFASSKDYNNVWTTPLKIEEEMFLITEIFFHIQLREITKNLKIPKLLEVYNHILISVFKKIDSIKIENKEYKNNYKSFSDLKRKLLIIDTELKEELNYIINKTHNYK